MGIENKTVSIEKRKLYEKNRRKKFTVYSRFATIEEKEVAQKLFSKICNDKNIIEVSNELLNFLENKIRKQ